MDSWEVQKITWVGLTLGQARVDLICGDWHPSMNLVGILDIGSDNLNKPLFYYNYILRKNTNKLRWHFDYTLNALILCLHIK